MNETALNAVINLFAIFSIKGKVKYSSARKNLDEYLSVRLGIKDPDEYISLFLEIFELYNISPQLVSDDKIQALLYNVCSQVKSKIPYEEQVNIFLHGLELARKDFRYVEERLFRFVGENFEISDEDYNSIKSFIFCENPDTITQDGFLLINSQPSNDKAGVLRIQEKRLQGDILVFYIKSINQFVFKYFGSDILIFEGGSVREGLFYTLRQGSIIRGQLKTNIYYSDISQKYFKYQHKNQIYFSARDVSYFFPGSKNGIHRFSFSEKSGQMIAIMGGSGVGKSTLLNLLNGSLEPNTGQININQFDIHNDYSKIEGVIGYIPQDDLVIGELSVYQNVFHNAKLCLSNLDDSEISSLVDKVLMDLNLYDVKDMTVGSPLRKTLSGGQRKRLNIALELIREPSILFVDEPTSGLSSRDSERIMILLKEQANKGKLVIVNIHQPSSFIYKLFDKLWILDKGGYPVYAGNPIDAVMYFKQLANHIDSDSCECPTCGNVNPEQVLDIIETSEIDASGKITEGRKYSPQELYKRYSENIQDEVEMPSGLDFEDITLNFEKPGRFKQFKIFSKRNLQSKFSNQQYIIINLLQAPILAIVVSLLTRFVSDEGYYFGLNKNFPSFVFMAVVVMLFQGMTLSAEEIIRDRAILQRESFLRLSRFSYINSKVVFLLSLSALQSFLFIATSSYVLEIHGMFFNYWLILFLTAAFANMAGLIISAGLNSVVTIYISIPLLIIPQILLCGLIVPFEDLQSQKARNNFVPVIGDMMVSRWAFEALTVNQFVNNKYTLNYFDIDRELAEYFVKGELVVPELGNIAQAVRNTKMSNRGQRSIPRRLKVISQKLQKLESDSLTMPFPLQLLQAASYSDIVNDSLQVYLRGLRDKYLQLYRSAESYKDNLTSKLVEEIGMEGLLDLKRSQYNTALGSILLRDNISELIEKRNRQIQVKVRPIYRKPESNFGRAHFYAPYKSLGELRIPTLSFNALIILLMTMALYPILYFNWLGRFLNGWKSTRLRIRKLF